MQTVRTLRLTYPGLPVAASPGVKNPGAALAVSPPGPWAAAGRSPPQTPPRPILAHARFPACGDRYSCGSGSSRPAESASTPESRRKGSKSPGSVASRGLGDPPCQAPWGLVTGCCLQTTVQCLSSQISSALKSEKTHRIRTVHVFLDGAKRRTALAAGPGPVRRGARGWRRVSDCAGKSVTGGGGESRDSWLSV